MSKKPVIQPQDKYVLRMPDGLRDRIKAYAERQGTSMNHEIVRILEIEFPEQWPVDDRLAHLGEMLSVLAGGRKDPRFSEFEEKVEETITGIITGRVTGVSPEIRDAVEGLWYDYQMRESEAAMDHAEDHYADRTDEEIASHKVTGAFEKYGDPLPKPIDPNRDYLHLIDVLPPEALNDLTQRIANTDIEGAIAVLKRLDKEEVSKRIEFHKLPLLEQYRLRNEIPPSSSDRDPFETDET